jgi:hypothetical protein
MGKLPLANVQIGHDPEGTFIGLITDKRRYAWPTGKVPSIVHALRACADGDPAPGDCNSMVFASGEHVAVTDEPAKVAYRNVHDQATMVIDAAWSHLMTKRSACMLANGLEETYRKLRPAAAQS